MRKWKILFWFFAVLTALDFISLPFQKTINLADFIGLFVGALILVPYYGYSHSIAIGNKRLWQVVFCILVALNLLVGLPPIYSETLKIFSGDDSLLRAFFVILALIVLVILHIPPFRYAFKSEKTWAPNA